MKVCFLAGTLGQGGAERQLLYMLQALQKAGVETRVICLTRGEIYQSRIESMGVEVEWVGASGSRLKRLQNVVKSLRKNRPDIVQSAHFYTNIYAAAAGKFLGIKSIGAIRNDLTSEIGADRIFGKWQVRLPDHLIANSELALRRAKDFGIPPQKIDFVKNAVHLGGDSQITAIENKRTINVLYVGRLAEQKRPEIFVELAFYLSQNAPELDLRFRMAGEGPLLENLKKQVTDYRLPENAVSFLGNRPDVLPLYQESDLLVLPSRFEGTPNVLLEAMACGLPIVATKVGGVPEIVSEKCGILVDPENKRELFEAARELVTNESLRRRLGRGGKEYVARNHSLEYLQKQLTGIYEKILAG